MDWSAACIDVVPVDLAADLLTSNFIASLDVLEDT